MLHNANGHQKKELTINNIQIRFDAFVIKLKYVRIRFIIKCNSLACAVRSIFCSLGDFIALIVGCPAPLR